MQLEARMLRQPCLHCRRLVGAVVVADRMDAEVLGHRALDLLQETEELFGSVARQALADHLAGLDVEGGEQRGCAVMAEPCYAWTRL